MLRIGVRRSVRLGRLEGTVYVREAISAGPLTIDNVVMIRSRMERADR